jgi:hypothetical protein
VNASASANWNGMSSRVKYPIARSVLNAGHWFSRPSPHAPCALGQVCGVPLTRISANDARVSSRNGATAAGSDAAPPRDWNHTVRFAMPGASGTGIGNRSPNPRTPASVPK